MKSNDEKTFEDFMNWLNSVPYEEKEPFCPFVTITDIGYCNNAYTEACWFCTDRGKGKGDPK